MSTETQFEQFKIVRDGFPALAFTGTQLAQFDNRSVRGPNQNRWTIVTLYRTQGGKIVAEVEHRTQWEGENDWTKASTFATAKEAIDWLQEGEDSLGRVSQAALEIAGRVDPEFAAAFVEQVD